MESTEVDLKKLKVAIVHDAFSAIGGAEMVVKALLEIFPQADIYTSFIDRKKFNKPGWRLWEKHKLFTTYMQFLVERPFNLLPKFISDYRNFFWMFPKAMESIRLEGYDLVISSHYLAAHGVITPESTLHISYTHTPARYFYSHYWEYLYSPFTSGLAGWLKRKLLPGMAHKFRIWDAAAALRPDAYVANSTAVKHRIRKYYNRKARVIFPPVNIDEFVPKKPVKKDKSLYVIFSRHVPYKRFDLAVKAFTQPHLKHLRLVVIGEGPQTPELKQIARGHSNIEFLGFAPRDVLIDVAQRAVAKIYPSYEDFGIVPVEALAAGTPVIAYAGGGAFDYVIPGKTGVLIYEQTVEAITKAVLDIQKYDFDPQFLSDFARKFSKDSFKQKFTTLVSKLYAKLIAWQKKQA